MAASPAAPRVPPGARAALALALSLLVRTTGGQPPAGAVRVTGEVTLAGTVEAVTPHGVRLVDESGARHDVLVPAPGDTGVPLTDGRVLAAEAAVTVGGPVDPSRLAKGQLVRFRARLRPDGRGVGELARIEVLADECPPGVTPVEEATDDDDGAVACDVVAAVTRAAPRRLVVALPAAAAWRGKRVLSLALAADAVAALESHDAKRLEPGARVDRLVALRVETGDLVARILVAENPASARVAARGDDLLRRRHQALSAEPRAEPRLVRSRHFAFLTDVSDREAAVILDTLETMVGLLEKYFGRRQQGIVEGFIVHDLAVWPEGVLVEPEGVAKIREPAGVCFTRTFGPRRSAVLYACDDVQVIQHECTHGWCHLAFGSVGPPWLAEGVAELGAWWRAGGTAVEVDPRILGHLRSARPRPTLAEVTAPGRPADWRDYAWRWALCHLLAHDPNYADRFPRLAVALMEGRPGAGFEEAFGQQAVQLAFDYDRFLDHVGNGYRVDLTSWPWKTPARLLADGGRAEATVDARRGWQSSGVRVEAGSVYVFVAKGSWTTAAAAEAVGPEGAADGRGMLVGALFSEETLGAPVPIRAGLHWIAPADGVVMLRCDDAWGELADNAGTMTVTVRRGEAP